MWFKPVELVFEFGALQVTSKHSDTDTGQELEPGKKARQYSQKLVPPARAMFTKPVARVLCLRSIISVSTMASRHCETAQRSVIFAQDHGGSETHVDNE